MHTRIGYSTFEIFIVSLTTWLCCAMPVFMMTCIEDALFYLFSMDPMIASSCSTALAVVLADAAARRWLRFEWRPFRMVELAGSLCLSHVACHLTHVKASMFLPSLAIAAHGIYSELAHVAELRDFVEGR